MTVECTVIIMVTWCLTYKSTMTEALFYIFILLATLGTLVTSVLLREAPKL